MAVVELWFAACLVCDQHHCSLLVLVFLCVVDRLLLAWPPLVAVASTAWGWVGSWRHYQHQGQGEWVIGERWNWPIREECIYMYESILFLQQGGIINPMYRCVCEN